MFSQYIGKHDKQDKATIKQINKDTVFAEANVL